MTGIGTDSVLRGAVVVAAAEAIGLKESVLDRDTKETVDTEHLKTQMGDQEVVIRGSGGSTDPEEVTIRVIQPEAVVAEEALEAPVAVKISGVSGQEAAVVAAVALRTLL